MFGDMTRQTSREMRDHLASTDWPSVFQEKDPETTCRKVTDIILDSMDLFIPSKTVSKKTGDMAWFDDSRRAAKKKRRLFQKSKKDNTDTSKAKPDVYTIKPRSEPRGVSTSS